MGIVTVEIKNFFNKESVLWKYQQRTLSVEVKWKRSARNSVFPASASPHLCLDLTRQFAFLQFWPWDRDNFILWNSLEEAENAPLFRIWALKSLQRHPFAFRGNSRMPSHCLKFICCNETFVSVSHYDADNEHNGENGTWGSFSSLSEMALWCPKLKYGTTFIS